MELQLGIALLVGLAVGFGCGVAWLRYQLKNHPEKLKAWLAEVEQLKTSARSAFDEVSEKVELFADKLEEDLRDAADSATAEVRARLGDDMIAKLRAYADELEAKIKRAVG